MYPDFDKTEIQQAQERDLSMKEQEYKQLKKKKKVLADFEVTDARAEMKQRQLSKKTPSEVD